MLTGPNVILLLKIAVSLTTVMLVASLVALACRRPRVHGILNVMVTVLVLVAVLGLEVVLRFLGVDMTAHMNEAEKSALTVHLCFSVPLVPVMGVMLATGRGRRVRVHLAVAVVFVILWTGMFVTGLFYLPHAAS